MGTIPSYPPPDLPLTGDEDIAAWQGDRQVSLTIDQLFDAFIAQHGRATIFRCPLGWLEVEPDASAKFYAVHFTDTVKFEDDFDGSDGYVRGTAPSAAYAIAVKYMAPASLTLTPVGTITLNTNRTVSFATIGGELTVQAGGALVFFAPGTKRGATDVFLTLKGGYTA